jgi:hypothetical protein
VAASEWPPTRATVRRCRAGDAFRGAVHGRSSSLEVVFETTHMRMRARYAQHDPAKELGEHLVDQSQRHPRIMPATCRGRRPGHGLCAQFRAPTGPQEWCPRTSRSASDFGSPSTSHPTCTNCRSPSAGRRRDVHRSIRSRTPRLGEGCGARRRQSAGRGVPRAATPRRARAHLKRPCPPCLSGQPNVPPETLRDCRVPRYLLLRLRPVQSSSAVPAGLPTGPRPRRSSRLPLLRQMPRPAGAGDPQG